MLTAAGASEPIDGSRVAFNKNDKHLWWFEEIVYTLLITAGYYHSGGVGGVGGVANATLIQSCKEWCSSHFFFLNFALILLWDNSTQCSPHPTDEGSRPRVTQIQCIPAGPRSTEQTKRPNILWTATILPPRQSSKAPPTGALQQTVPAPDDQGLHSPDPAGSQPPQAPTCEVGVPTSPRAHILTRTTAPQGEMCPTREKCCSGPWCDAAHL